MGQAVDVLARPFRAAANCDEQDVKLGLVNSKDDPIALTGRSQVAVSLEFTQERLPLAFGNSGDAMFISAAVPPVLLLGDLVREAGVSRPGNARHGFTPRSAPQISMVSPVLHSASSVPTR